MKLTKFEAPSLISVTPDMDWEQRDAAHDANIKTLADVNQQSILLIASELYANKFTGAYKTSSVWKADDVERNWSDYLTLRKYQLTDGDRLIKVTWQKASQLMMWGVACACIQAENGKRVASNLPMLPLPTNPAQLEPYQGVFTKVDDWQPEEWPEEYPRVDIEAPWADDQTGFIGKWEAVFNQLPPEKRLDKKGQPKPPSRDVSRDYISKERQMLTPDLKEPNYMEIDPSQESKLLNVGQTATTAERMAAAATAAAQLKSKQVEKKTAKELEEERKQFELEANVRKYRMQLLSLQQQAESLEGMLKSLLATNGSDYLEAMRDQNLGAYSVTEDVALLRKAVMVIQSCFRLATEVYVAPEGIEVETPDYIDV